MNGAIWLVIAGGVIFVLTMVLLMCCAQITAQQPVPLIDRSTFFTATVRYFAPSEAEDDSLVVMVEHADGEMHCALHGSIE